MADKLVITLDLESGDITSAFKDIEKQAKGAGKKSGKKYSKEFSNEIDFTDVRKRFIALAASIGAAFTLRKSIAAAIQQEEAVNRLAGALKSSNEFTKEAIADFEAYAAALQGATRFGDEIILNQIALAKAFGATNQQAKDIVKVAADLSAALGIDLNSATRNVAKTLGGYAGELGETIPELKNLTQAQLQAGGGIDILAKKFSGQAKNAVFSFAGALDQAQNNFGDYLEKQGFVVTKSPAVIAALQGIGSAFKELGKDAGLDEAFTIKPSTIELLSLLGEGVRNFVLLPLELLGNISKVAFAQLQESVAAGVAIVGNALGSIGDLINEKLGIDNKFTKSLQTFRDSSNETFQDFAKDSGKALD